MKSSNSNKHLTMEERIIIEHGIRNGSSKSAIANTLGKDKSTIGKEIKAHRRLTYKCPLPLECADYRHCKLGRSCKPSCSKYVPFTCKRRDRTPGACNGCQTINTCRFNHFFYTPSDAHHDYRMTLVTSREGINYTETDVITVGNIIQPEIKKVFLRMPFCRTTLRSLCLKRRSTITSKPVFSKMPASISLHWI